MAGLSRLKIGLRGLKRRRVILLGLLLLLLAFGGYKAQRVWRLARSLQSWLDELQAMADNSAEVELRDVGESLRGAHADLEALRSEVALFMPLTRYLGWVPVVGGDLRAAPALLDVALAVTEAGTTAFDGLEPLLELAEGERSKEEPLALVLQTLTDARPNLETARGRLATALARRAEINDDALSARTASLVARLDRYLPLMQTALDGGRLAPDLMGASGRQTYLILAQNNDELRATGGFISAVGTLVLDGGEIVEIAFEDSYAVDDFSQPYPDPPSPYPRYLGIDLWVFRDANWWPDFPTSAQAAVELYCISRDLDVDGVLAVDQHALQTIVAALSPLEVEGWPEPVTGENVISFIRLAWSPTDVEDWSGFDVEWWRQRKSFIGDLVGAMRAKVERSPDQVNWLALARAVLRTLDERHLQIWLADSTGPAADLLAEQGWDGAMRRSTSDYLMVVDANMGFNKVDALIQESLDYRVLVSADGTAQATLTIRHVNRSTGEATCDHRPHYGADYEDIMNRCYWDYLRVYAPAGSQLYAATAHPVPANQLVSGRRQGGEAEVLPAEKGKAVFASFFVLPREQETQTRFVYQLPPTALEPPAPGATDQSWRYRLLVQKQAGTHAIPLRVTLALPPGASVESAISLDGAQDGPAVQQPEPNIVVFDTTLDEDRAFEVNFRLNED
jgi:hypothetical protein